MAFFSSMLEKLRGRLKLEIGLLCVTTTRSPPKDERATFPPSSLKAPTGLVIWICEGTKRNHRQVEVVNDNELVVRAFLEYLRSFGIEEERLRARVQCSSEDVKSEQVRWSKITSIPITQFTKPIVKAGTGVERKSNSVIVRYSSQSLKQQLLSEGKRFGLML